MQSAFNKKFVAVFDSGIGGLTVLSELKKVAPQCDFLYLADHAFFPYGIRAASEIRSRVLKVSKFLKRLGAFELVVACNTASLFVNDIRSELAIPVFDVIYPTCGAVIENVNCKNVALLATNTTAESGVYGRILKHYGVKLTSYRCSELVTVAESNLRHNERLNAVQSCLGNFASESYDAVILGCTHFPLLQSEIAAYTGGATIVSCAQPITRYFMKNHKFAGTGLTKYVTTGNIELSNYAVCAEAVFTHVDLY